MVGLIPLFAVETLEPETAGPAARLRAADGVVHRQPAGPDASNVACMRTRRARASGGCSRSCGRTSCGAILRAHARRERVPLALRHPRALARPPRPSLRAARGRRTSYGVRYEPGESRSGLFGGNSNWRGPIWFPSTTCSSSRCRSSTTTTATTSRSSARPARATMLTLCGGRGGALAAAVAHLPARTRRPAARVRRRSSSSRTIRTGATCSSSTSTSTATTAPGSGASHQTGWTGLVAKLLQQSGE